MKKILTTLVIFFTFIGILILIPNKAFAARIQRFSCSTPVATASWPRNIFKSTCNISLKKVGSTPHKLGIYVSSYTTSKLSGNGPNINFITPENPSYRFKARGIKQADVPANITTSTTYDTVTTVEENITGSNFSTSFELLYTTYEADYGGTSYSHTVTVGLYSKDNYYPVDTATYNFPFTIANKQYVNISGPVTINLSPAQVFNLNQYYNSNPVTVEVKANNIWRLQAKIQGSTALENYFMVSGSGFTNLAPSLTRFLNNDFYYDAARNLTGEYTTGSANGIYLSGKNVILTYSLYNRTVLNSGNYSYNTITNLISP